MTEPTPASPPTPETIYVEQAAAILGLEIPPEYYPGVVENFERIRAIAQVVMEFPISEAIETAPVFQP